MERRDFLRAVGVGAATLALPGCVKTSRRSIRKNKQPNIIYILADDLGYGDLGCYGQKRIKTPNLDKMAAEGMQFTQHYAGSTVCDPSRCCLMTGLHTGRARVRGNAFVPLEPGDITVAKVLKKAGYSTAIIGKWGLGEEASTGIPTRQGFDYFYGYLSQIHAHNYYPEYLWRNEQKVAHANSLAEGGSAPLVILPVQKLMLFLSFVLAQQRRCQGYTVNTIWSFCIGQVGTGRQDVPESRDMIAERTGFDLARPSGQHGHSNTALIQLLFSAS